MQHFHSKYKCLAGLAALAIFFSSCTSDQSSHTTSDTATGAYPSMDGAEQSMTPSDTVTVPLADTATERSSD